MQKEIDPSSAQDKYSAINSENFETIAGPDSFLGENPILEMIYYAMITGIALASAWFLWQGLTPTEVLLGVPFHKHLTTIKWPESSLASNTKVGSL